MVYHTYSREKNSNAHGTMNRTLVCVSTYMYTYIYTHRYRMLSSSKKLQFKTSSEKLVTSHCDKLMWVEGGDSTPGGTNSNVSFVFFFPRNYLPA